MDKKSAYELASKFVEFLKEKEYNILDAYLFGSYAKGTYNEDSDIDLAIIFDSYKDSFDTQVNLMKLRRKFDLRIEPHPFLKKDIVEFDPFITEVMRTGVKI